MNIQINQNLVPPAKYSLKCPHEMSPEGLCIHNTANDAPAKNEISYMVGNANQTSFHFAVDDKEIWQGLPLDRAGWHAGDGNGAGNRKHIGIEICYSKSGGDRFNKAEDRAVELVVHLLKQRGWGTDRVKKHQDFSGKYCPHRTLDLGWGRFIKKIEEKLGSNMADMYGTPNQYDLSNRDSMKIAVDHLNDILTGKYVRVEDKAKLEEDLKKEKEFSGKLVSNIDGIKAILGLSQFEPIEAVLATIQSLKNGSSTPEIPNQPPKEILVHGERWALNGMGWSDGKLQGNYKRL